MHRTLFSLKCATVSAFVFLLTQQLALADVWDKTSLSTTFTGLSTQSIAGILSNLADWLLYVIGFVSIISFVIAGIQYFLAGADEGMAERAKKTMVWSIAGTVVAISGLVIIYAADEFLNAGIF